MTEEPGRGWANPAWGEPSRPPDSPGTPAQPPPGLPPPAHPPAGGYAAPGGYAPPGSYRPAPYGPGPSGPYAAPDPKPGIIPLRPLGVGEVLDGALTTVRSHPRLTIGLAAAVVTVQQLLSLVAQATTGPLRGAFNPGAGIGGGATSSLTPFSSTSGLALSGANFVIGTVLGAILTGVLMIVVGDSVLGRPVGLAGVWARVRPRFWALLGGSLLAGLLPWLGLIIAVAVGVVVGVAAGSVGWGIGVGLLTGLLMLAPSAYLWGMLALTTPAITLERLGPIQGLRRSWRLVRRDFWRVWGIRALGTVLAQIISSIIAVPFALVGVGVILSGGLQGEPSAGRWLAFLIVVGIGGIIAGAIVQPFLAAVVGLLYVDRRMRGEGLDIALRDAARTQRPGAAGTGWG